MVMQQQHEDEWCWAAVAVSVDHYFDTASTWTQESLASQIAGSGDVPEALQDALTAVSRLNGNPETDSLQFDEVKTAIDACMPLCIRIGWSGGGAHFVALDGYGYSAANEELVHVKDPYFGDSTVLFNDFLNDYLGCGNWTATFPVKE
jgi:hypothetical protein